MITTHRDGEAPRSQTRISWNLSVSAALILGVAAFQLPIGVAPVAVAAQQVDTRAFMKQYCLGCHSAQARRSGNVPVAFDNLDPSNVAPDARTWEQVVRKMRAGVMPPSGMPRADKAVHERFLTFVEGELDRAARANPNPGRSEAFHRLNRKQYQNAVRDLLNLDIDVTALLPPDDASYGFDNIAGVLRISPTLMERYLTAAQKISRTAVGLPPSSPNIDYFRVADDRAQEDRLPSQLFGTRGGASIDYTFPMDAHYTIRVELSRDLNEQVPIYAEPQLLEVSIDGERVNVFTLPGVDAPPPPPPSEPVAASDVPADDPVAPSAQPAERGRGAGAAGQRGAGAGARGGGGGRGNRQGQAQRNRADRDWEIRVPVTAGPHQVQVAFVKQSSAVAETARLPFLRPYPAGVNIAETRTGAYLRSVEIAGPFDPTGPGNSPSRQRIFTCQPTSSANASTPKDQLPTSKSAAGQPRNRDADACARSILGALARRAYRRPVTSTDIEPLMTFYREGVASGSFDEGIDHALQRLLISPEFLLRVEADPAGIPANTPYRISDVELASRLSFFLWSSIPDEELLRLAEERRLRNPAVLQRQLRRMIADERFDSFVEQFAGQWLFLRNLAASIPVQQNFPDFDDTLRESFRVETEMFVDSVIREDRSALDLLRADYTFLNERLARHYGIPNVKGNRFRRVVLPADSHRGGLLGHGSILTVTSYPDRTSPVVRGKWILENLMGTPPPPPIPGVPALKPPSFAGKVLTMRERIAAHRNSPVCASCHSMMDPLGLALEHFDGVGKWRALDESGAPIDATGTLPDGTKFDGVDGLRQALLSSDRFVATLTEKMLIYALGRGVEYHDLPAVRAIVRDAARDDYRFTSLIRAIIESAPFQMRRSHS
jgi:mono/diheme cytochrome c family protein